MGTKHSDTNKTKVLPQKWKNISGVFGPNYIIENRIVFLSKSAKKMHIPFFHPKFGFQSTSWGGCFFWFMGVRLPPHPSCATYVDNAELHIRYMF